MAASLIRHEFYYTSGRLVSKTNTRRTLHSKWKLAGKASELVAAIEDRKNQKRKLVTGQAANPMRLAHSLVRFERLQTDSKATDFSPKIPRKLLQATTTYVKDRVSDIRHFFHTLNEERHTGVVMGDIDRLNRANILAQDGWEAAVFVQGFSSVSKEPLAGADIGIICDIVEGSRKVSKAVWIQAKYAETYPDDVWSIEDLSAQMDDMLAQTKEAYAMIYTPEGVTLFKGKTPDATLTLDELLTGILSCQRGDRDPLVLANTLYKNFLVEMVFSGPSAGMQSKAEWNLEGF